MKSKPLYLALVLASMLVACSSEKEVEWAVSQSEAQAPAIIPQPQQLALGEVTYEVPSENQISYTGEASASANWLQELLSRAGIAAGISSSQTGGWQLHLSDTLNQLGEEGYRLDISARGVQIQAATQAGLFYGIQTLRQLLPSALESGQVEDKPLLLPELSIEDVPHYSWRGTMVDVARSFFDLEYLKKHVDRMATYKMNRLHLHLTDDQGWRIEIKGWPKLTEVGGDSAVKDGRSGYLTQEEYKELQSYAAARNIIIVPEIDMPGHIYAALRSYPEELNCPDYTNIAPRRATPPEPYTGTTVGWSKFCLENPAIYDFVTDVIREMSEITTGPWIHIGGDEIQDPRYEEFVVKADSIVQDFGKTTIGWEEVTKAEVSNSLISQVWHGRVESVVDVEVIQSICGHFYLDHANVEGQEHTNNWCKSDGITLEEVYDFRSEHPRTLGVEAPVWSEFVITDERMDDRFWPRSLAVAEIGWTAPEKRDYQDFFQRVQQQVNRLNAMGIHYHQTPGIDWRQGERSDQHNDVFAGFMPE